MHKSFFIQNQITIYLDTMQMYVRDLYFSLQSFLNLELTSPKIFF